MELDHVFIFIQEAGELAGSLHRFGLTEGTPNVHPGQGTACRRFFFHNSYLELFWVVNEDEITGATVSKTKLWERSRYQVTNHCPFGLCFRTGHEEHGSGRLIFDDGWRYYSAFLPMGQFANIAPNENYTAEPMLFEMPFFGLSPKNYLKGKEQPLIHEKRFKEISRVSLTLPTAIEELSTSMKKVIDSGIVEVTEGTCYWLNLEFDHALNGGVQSFYPLAPLTIKW